MRQEDGDISTNAKALIIILILTGGLSLMYKLAQIWHGYHIW